MGFRDSEEAVSEFDVSKLSLGFLSYWELGSLSVSFFRFFGNLIVFNNEFSSSRGVPSTIGF